MRTLVHQTKAPQDSSQERGQFQSAAADRQIIHLEMHPFYEAVQSALKIALQPFLLFLDMFWDTINPSVIFSSARLF